MLSGMGRSVLSTAIALGLAIALACDRAPSSPSPSSVGSGTTMTGLTIGGPSRIAPGAAASFKATATYSDGTTKDVTAEAAWTPTAVGPAISVYFTGPGMAVGANRGEGEVAARLGAKQSSQHVLVLEDGTFKLSGTVAETGGRLVPGASVDVISGTGSGLHAVTDTQGRYALYGVAGQIRLRASSPGLNTEERDAVVSSDASLDPLALAPLERPESIGDTWVMALAPSASCSGGPADLIRSRRYEVTFVQQGTGLKLTIASPTLHVYNPNENGGTVFGSHVSFTFIGDTDYGDWSSADIQDLIGAGQRFEFDGLVDGTVAGSEIRALLNGDFMYYDGTGSFGPTWWCRAKDHAVTLRRNP